MFFIDNVYREKLRHENNIKIIEDNLKQYPPGQLHHIVDKGYDSFRVYNKGHYERIRTKEQDRVRMMVEKKLLQLELKDEILLMQAADAYISAWDQADFKKQKYIDGHPFIQGIIASNISTEEAVRVWKEQAYVSEPSYPERRVIRTIDGVMVRSRAEMTIANQLVYNNIPYRYEEKLNIGGAWFHADFHILHPLTLKEYIWEYFGLMNDPAYARNAQSKIIKYTQNGYIPGQNLILTFEDDKQSLDARWIQQQIEHYFGQVKRS